MLRNYTHMKCDPSVSGGWVGGPAEAEDSGDEGRLFTKTPRKREKRNIFKTLGEENLMLGRTCFEKEVIVAFGLLLSNLGTEYSA